jgi:hypothetical protein
LVPRQSSLKGTTNEDTKRDEYSSGGRKKRKIGRSKTGKERIKDLKIRTKAFNPVAFDKKCPVEYLRGQNSFQEFYLETLGFLGPFLTSDRS